MDIVNALHIFCTYIVLLVIK